MLQNLRNKARTDTRHLLPMRGAVWHLFLLSGSIGSTLFRAYGLKIYVSRQCCSHRLGCFVMTELPVMHTSEYFNRVVRFITMTPSERCERAGKHSEIHFESNQSDPLATIGK